MNLVRMNRVFNETTRKIEELMHEVTNSKLLNKEMEFKALQAQINPHFLYNALDTVRLDGYEKRRYRESVIWSVQSVI
ncbi:MAG: sensor histidine kinase [Ruminococcus sp.]